MLHAHNFLRWIVLILALLTIIRSLSGMMSKKSFTPQDRKTPLFFMIAMDIQLLLGLGLYFTSAVGLKNIQNQGMGAVMKDAFSRFWAVEHLTGMLIAVILAHLAVRAGKKSIADEKKFKQIFIFSLLSFIIMIATIPWPFRETIGRGLFPGM